MNWARRKYNLTSIATGVGALALAIVVSCPTNKVGKISVSWRCVCVDGLAVK